MTVGPAARGRGVARRALAAAEGWLDVRERPREFSAVVHADNAASRRLFEGAGYTLAAGPDAQGFTTLVKAHEPARADPS